MGTELDISQELANVCVALSETTAIAQIIHGNIRKPEFLKRFNSILCAIADCADIITSNLNPYWEIDSERALIDNFDTLHAYYTGSYLKEISKPRVYSDEAYEAYILLRLLKETKTGFPLLKRTFGRLDKFIDQWITNDAWLAMSIDNLFKRLQTLFNEIAAIKARDPEDAFVIYNQAFEAFKPFLDLIGQKHDQLLADKTPAPISQVI